MCSVYINISILCICLKNISFTSVHLSVCVYFAKSLSLFLFVFSSRQHFSWPAISMDFWRIPWVQLAVDWWPNHVKSSEPNEQLIDILYCHRRWLRYPINIENRKMFVRCPVEIKTAQMLYCKWKRHTTFSKLETEFQIYTYT